MRSLSVRFCSLLAIGILTALSAPAQTVAPPQETTAETQLPEETVQPQDSSKIRRNLAQIWRWSDAQLRGIFDVVLPETQERGTWKFSLQPRVGDFFGDDFVRMPMGVAYGFNKRTEGELEIDSYFANPWRDASGFGISNYRLSFKRRWKPTPESKTDAASGIRLVWPEPSSPDSLNQGVNRVSSFVAFSRKFGEQKQYEGILNLSYDYITSSDAGGVIAEHQPQDDFFRIAPGVLYKRGRFTYGLSAGWAHTVDGGATDFFTLSPSLIYEIPPKYIFNSPGRWQVGFALEGRHYSDEYDLALRFRVRWLGSIRRVYEDWREQRRAARLFGPSVAGSDR